MIIEFIIGVIFGIGLTIVIIVYGLRQMNFVIAHKNSLKKSAVKTEWRKK